MSWMMSASLKKPVKNVISFIFHIQELCIFASIMLLLLSFIFVIFYVIIFQLYDPTAQKKQIRINIVCPLRVDKPITAHSKFATEEGRAEIQAMTDDPEKRAAMSMCICR